MARPLLCLLVCTSVSVAVSAAVLRPSHRTRPPSAQSLDTRRLLSTAQPPPDWAAAAASSDLLYTLDADGPSPADTDANLLPNVANGYAGVRLASGAMYAAGVYVGDGLFFEDYRGAARARIPCVPAGVTLAPAAGTRVGVALDMRRALVEQRYTLGSATAGNVVPDAAAPTVTVRLYAHQSRRSLMVLHVVVNDTALARHGTGSASVSVPLSVPAFTALNATASDIPFVAAATPAACTAANLTCVAYSGRVVKGEVPDAPRPLVAVVQQRVPASLTVAAGAVTELAFVTAVRSQLDSTSAVDDAAADLAAAAAVSPAALLAEHVAAWAVLWEGGVEVAGNGTLATHVNSTYYYLLSQNRADFPAPAAPGGLATDFYNGNAFWDGVTFITPSLSLFHPPLAAASLQYRFTRMPEAVAYAAKHGWRGAYWPFQTAATGQSVDVFEPANVKEQHIVSEVALLGEQYYATTGDAAWLAAQGAPMAAQAAEFWMSRVVASSATPNALSILNTVPADEFAIGNISLAPGLFPYTGVDDAVFTNAGAQRTLQWAAHAATLVPDGNLTRAGQWRETASRITLLFDPATRTHPEYRGFPRGNWDSDYKVKQADVILLPWPLGVNVSHDVVVRDLDMYEPMYFAQGPDMTWAASCVGYLSAVDRGVPGPNATAPVLHAKAAAGFARARLNQQAPFDVWTETPNPNKHAGDLGAYNFVTGASTWALALTSGYMGIRVTAAGNGDGAPLSMSFAPQLPTAVNVTTLRVRGVSYRGWQVTVTCSDTPTGVACDVLPTSATAAAQAMVVQAVGASAVAGAGDGGGRSGPVGVNDVKLCVGTSVHLEPAHGASAGVGPRFRLVPTTGHACREQL